MISYTLYWLKYEDNTGRIENQFTLTPLIVEEQLMKQSFIQLIGRLATGRNFIIMIGVWLAYAVLVMGAAEPDSSAGVGPVDLTFAAAPGVICHMIGSYGEALRHHYMWSEIIWDGIYPLIYGFMLLLGFSYVSRRAGIADIYNGNLVLLPLLVVGADYCENIGIVTLLLTYPSCSLNVATLASIFVTIKWIMTIVCLLFLIVVFILGRKHKPE